MLEHFSEMSVMTSLILFTAEVLQVILFLNWNYEPFIPLLFSSSAY